jgi:hypothetical protein
MRTAWAAGSTHCKPARARQVDGIIDAAKFRLPDAELDEIERAGAKADTAA